jgi:hypothetical protein
MEILSLGTITEEERKAITGYYAALDRAVDIVFSKYKVEKKSGKFREYYISKGEFKEPSLRYELQLNDFIDSTVDTVAYFYFPTEDFDRPTAESHLSLMISHLSLGPTLSASYLFLGSTTPKRSAIDDFLSLETLELGEEKKVAEQVEKITLSPTTGGGMLFQPGYAVIASEGGDKKEKNSWLWIVIIIAVFAFMFFMFGRGKM